VGARNGSGSAQAGPADRTDDHWLILDNRMLALVRDMNIVRAIPGFVLDQRGI
jgi:hypothetical protein